MKKLGLIVLLTLITSTTFAADCAQDAKEVAKMNLDQVARKYGFESSDIVDSAKVVKTVKVKITKDISETLTVFSVAGSIYKGDYSLLITLDESCAVRAVTIHDDASL